MAENKKKKIVIKVLRAMFHFYIILKNQMELKRDHSTLSIENI